MAAAIDLRGQRLACLLGAALANQLTVLDPDLAVDAVLLEEGRAEATARVAQRDLVGRHAGGGDDGLGHLVERDPRLGEGRRQRLEPLPGARASARRTTGARSGSWLAISSQVRSPRLWTGETSSRPSGTSPGVDRIVGVAAGR